MTNPVKEPFDISVILPYFNAAETLEEAISSILGQEHKNLELILVDNNSTDNSRAIAEKQASRDKRIVITNEKKQGVVFAFRKGYSLARGKYISRMDADDIALPEKLGAQFAYLEANPTVAAVAGKAIHLPHRSNTEGLERYVQWSNSVQSFGDIFKKRFIESPLINPTVVWRRTASEQHGIYRNGDFPEDYEMWLRWLEAGLRIEKLDRFVLKWRDSDSRLTRTHSIYSEEAFYRIKSQYLYSWLKENSSLFPEVWVWGASRLSRKRVSILEDLGIEIKGFIDLGTKRKLDKKVISYKSLPPSDSAFILSYVAEQDSREQTRAYLEKQGYREGISFLMVS